MKLHLKIVSLKCAKKFSDIFKRLIDEEGIRVGVAISHSWDELQRKDLKFTDLSRRSDKDSNSITWNFPMELELSGLDKRLCFEFQHRGNSLSRGSCLLSELHKNLGSRGECEIENDQGKGKLLFICKFSED